MENLPIELVNKIIMMNRTIYPFISEFKIYIVIKRRNEASTKEQKRNLNALYGKQIDVDTISLYPLQN